MRRIELRSLARLMAVMGGAGTLLLMPAQAAAEAPVHFTTPVYVDLHRAGGEPLVLADAGHGTFVYTSHQGTTHLLRDGVRNAPGGDVDFGTTDGNQVFVWTSTDLGRTWNNVNFLGPFTTNPAINTGFSDPDLTQDAAGRIYDTGINLANDSLFSSKDGGKTWDKGTIQCHDGDRPWLAGADREHVYLATDTAESNANLGHEIFESTDGGATCSSTPLAKDFTTYGPGPTANLEYEGFGKLYLNHHDGFLYEPYIHYNNPESGNQAVDSVGVSRIDPATGTVTRSGRIPTTLFGHWPALSIDTAGNVYLVWDTDNRLEGGQGCGGSASSSATQDSNPAAAPNSIQLAVFKGADISTPPTRSTIVSAPRVQNRDPGTSYRVLWPWITAGDAGKISVVWYQTDRLADPDCQVSNVRLMEATIFNALDLHPTVNPVDAAGRIIHFGTVCQGGTFCVVSGKDRRLGDFFTNSIDSRGCVLIASGDTMVTENGQQLPTSRPIFMSQDSGPGLLGHDCAQVLAAQASATPAPIGLPPTLGPAPAGPLLPAALLLAGLLLIGLTTVGRRRA